MTTADRCVHIFKVTQGHRLLFQSKAYIHDFLLVISWDLSSILHRLQDMAPRIRKPAHPPLSRQFKGTPVNFVIKPNTQIAEV